MSIKRIVAAATLVGLMLGVASSSQGAFLGIESTGGISLNTRSELNGDRVTYYGGPQNLVNYSLRVPMSSESIFKFDLTPLSGQRIVSASLAFNIFLAQSTGAATVMLYVRGFGSSSTVGSPTDFGGSSGPMSNASLNLGAALSAPKAFSLDQTDLIRSLTDSRTAAVGYDFGVFSPSNVAFNGLVLNVVYEANAVPEPSSLLLCGVASVVGGGYWSLRRRRRTLAA